MKTAPELLTESAALLAERGKQYDSPGGERSMGKAVAAFNAITSRDLTEAEGWLLMECVKNVRNFSVWGSGHRDSVIDAIAYAALMAESVDRMLCAKEAAKAGDQERIYRAVGIKPVDASLKKR